MNRVTISGNLTKDIELKESTSGKPVCTFAVAVNDYNHTSFVYCQAWQHNAEYLKNYAKKGDKLLVDGRIEVRTVENEHGETRTYTMIIVNSVEAWTKQSLDSAKKAKNKTQSKEFIPY